MARTTPRAPVRLEPLWLRVERNRVKLALFIGGFLLACVLAAEVLVLVPLLSLVFLQGWQAGNLSPSARLAGAVPDVAAWVAAGSVVLGVAYVGVTLARPVRRLLPAIGAERAPRGELLPTKHALKDMAIACGVQVAPEMYVVESTSVNAFVVGWGRERPVCVVTRGLVERFHADEQRAVFARLMA
ncbi:MAG: M48 family metalloprotease, partial [Coriobacteriia bacterium]|nr:M48 family metalloprotease [Coriobacteriia bacterium]